MNPGDPQWWEPPIELHWCEGCGELTDALEPGPVGRRVCTECGEVVDGEPCEAPPVPSSAECE